MVGLCRRDVRGRAAGRLTLGGGGGKIGRMYLLLQVGAVGKDVRDFIQEMMTASQREASAAVTERLLEDKTCVERSPEGVVQFGTEGSRANG